MLDEGEKSRVEGLDLKQRALLELDDTIQDEIVEIWRICFEHGESTRAL
jgi:hypothetical protein